MTMDWANERYVRLYTRDTAEWLCLPWQARAVWPLLVRKADRSGIIETRLGSRGLAALVALPEDVTAPGVEGLLVDGCLEVHALGYLIPNYLEAQETPQSDGQRKRESRERRRVGVTPRHGGSRGVTIRDQTSQNVTKGHAVSHAVTRGHEVSLLSEPSRADPDTDAFPTSPPGVGVRLVAAQAGIGADDSAPPTRKTPPRARGQAGGPITREQANGVPDPPEEAMQAAYLLAEFVEQNHPEGNLAKQPEITRERTMLQWGDIVRKMHSIDRLAYEQINAMISWSQRSPYWLTRIRTAESLRKAWDEMAAQRKYKPAPNGKAATGETPEAVKARRDKERAREQAETERQRAADAAAEAERDEVAGMVAELKTKLTAVPA